MRVYIIGAGPGDPKLITLRAAELIARCPVVLYTGSLVPAEVVKTARADAKVLDSAGMTLDQIVDVFVQARADGHDPSRSKTVPNDFFAGSAGILMTDRLASYKGLQEAIIKAWCWAHMRRDFFNIYKLVEIN